MGKLVCHSTNCLVFSKFSLLVFLWKSVRLQKVDNACPNVSFDLLLFTFDIYCKLIVNIKFFLVENFVTCGYLLNAGSIKTAVLHKINCFKSKNKKFKKSKIQS